MEGSRLATRDLIMARTYSVVQVQRVVLSCTWHNYSLVNSVIHRVRDTGNIILGSIGLNNGFTTCDHDLFMLEIFHIISHREGAPQG